MADYKDKVSRLVSNLRDAANQLEASASSPEEADKALSDVGPQSCCGTCTGVSAIPPCAGTCIKVSPLM